LDGLLKFNNSLEIQTKVLSLILFAVITLDLHVVNTSNEQTQSWYQEKHVICTYYIQIIYKLYFLFQGSESNFYRQRLSDGADVNKMHYDVSSIMHYSEWVGERCNTFNSGLVYVYLYQLR